MMSFAALLLELALTRLFSVMLFYHFAFLAISIALLGLGAGGGVRVPANGLAGAVGHGAPWARALPRPTRCSCSLVLEVDLHAPVSLAFDLRPNFCCG